MARNDDRKGIAPAGLSDGPRARTDAVRDLPVAHCLAARYSCYGFTMDTTARRERLREREIEFERSIIEPCGNLRRRFTGQPIGIVAQRVRTNADAGERSAIALHRHDADGRKDRLTAHMDPFARKHYQRQRVALKPVGMGQMKISVDVDCTPDEARRFMGLPDLSQVHEIYLEKMRRSIDEGITPEGVATLIQSWSPMGEAGMAMWKQLFDQMGGRSPKK